MVPSGPPTPGGGQAVTPSLLRSNSNILGGQGSGGPSQAGFPSLVSPRNQYNSMNLMGNMANVSSLLNNSFGNGGSNSGLSGSGSLQRGGIDTGAESDPLSNVGNSMNFAPSVSFGQSNSANTNAGGQNQGQQFSNSSGNQLVQDQLQHQQLDLQNFQHGQQSLQQFSIPQTQQQQQQQQQHQLQQHQQQQQQQQHQQLQQHAQQQQYQSIRGGQGGGGAVKLEPQTSNEQNGPQQQLQSMRTLNQVKLEPQQLQNIRSLPPVKMEHQHLDQSLFLQQQQQQQFLHLSRQSSAAAAQMSMLQQQRILQMQQQQQQQLLKALPQPRSQVQQQFQAQNLPVRTASKPAYEPGMCARRLTHYMYHQQHRPADNNIEFWRKFVAEYFAPHAKKRWCVSLYGSGRQTTGVFPQDVWHCEICNQKPGRGFETTVEVLPRLCKIKYDSGTLEELLYVDMPREYQNASGQIVLDYAKAIQESVFEQLRVVRDGQLRIVFSPDLKICSWEFCARRHEELIPRRLIVPQVGQLGSTAQKYQQAQTSASNSASTVSNQELQNNCNMFVQSTRQLAKALEVPLVNDLGYTKRYVRCLQISEVVNSMKDLIDYSRETGNGPMASLINFPRRTSGIHGHGQQPEEQQPQQQQTIAQNSNNGQATSMQLPSSNGVTGVHNPLNTTSTSTSASTIVGLLHQNSMNSRHESPMNNGTSLYGGTAIQIPSASSSSSLPQSQANPSSPFASPTPSTSNNIPQTLPVAATGTPHLSSANSPANMSIQQPTQSNEAAEQNDSQSSVQQILQEMMMSSQLNGGGSMIGLGSLGNDMKNINGMTGNATAVNGGLVGNGMTNNSAGMSSVGFGNMGGGIGVGIRGTMGTNSTTLNGRVGMGSMQQDISMSHQQQELGNRLLNGLGAVNGFNNHQFD